MACTSFRATLVAARPFAGEIVVRDAETGDTHRLGAVNDTDVANLLQAVTANVAEPWDAVVLVVSCDAQKHVLYDIARDDEKFACAQCCDLVEASHDGKICDVCRDAGMGWDDAEYQATGPFDTTREREDH